MKPRIIDNDHRANICILLKLLRFYTQIALYRVSEEVTVRGLYAVLEMKLTGSRKKFTHKQETTG